MNELEVNEEVSEVNDVNELRMSPWLLEGDLVMKPAKHQRSKQRCQDLGWAQSFVLPSYTMHELRNQHVSIG